MSLKDNKNLQNNTINDKNKKNDDIITNDKNKKNDDITITNDDITITNDDIFKNIYPIKILENNIDNLNLKYILITQKNLTAEFCVKYILNEDYIYCKDEIDETIAYIDAILYYQRQLTRKDLLDLMN